MRAALSRAFPVAVAVAAAVPATAAAEPGERMLERGDRGGDVRALQDVLTRLDLPTDADGATPGMRPTGSPGGDTPLPGATADQPDPSGAGTYPVDGPHTYGDGFGARGGHQGQDVMADCGTPLRAVKDVTVRRVATQAAAGRYIVLHDADSGEDYVYMHMSAVDVTAGDTVTGGETVGETGDATACHLHFEEWTAPGWYAGGRAKDPLAFLHSLSSS